MEIKDNLLVNVVGDYMVDENSIESITKRNINWGLINQHGYDCDVKAIQVMRLFALTLTKQMFEGKAYVNELKSTIDSDFSEEDLVKFEEMFLVMENKVIKEYLESHKNGLKPRGNPLTRLSV